MMCILGLVLVLVLHQCAANSESHAGLSTTFGQTNKQNQQNNNNNNQPLRGKICTVEANCTAFVNTSCVKDPRDGNMRCLCGDRKPPNNGICKNTRMSLGFRCTVDGDCIENAECVDPSNMNPNMTMAVSPTPMTSSMVKTCMCRMGFEEDDTKLHCNSGADTILLSVTLALVSVYVQFGQV